MRSRPWSRLGDVVACTAVAFWLLPVAWIALTSIKPTTEINSVQPVFWGFAPTLEHYGELFQRFEFSRIMLNSFLIVPAATLIVIVLAVFSAYALARLPLKGADQIALFILSFRFMPGMLVVLPYYLMFQGVGLLDTHHAVTLPVQLSKMIDAYSVLWGPLSAAVILQLLPMIAVVFFIQKHMVRGLALGAVK